MCAKIAKRYPSVTPPSRQRGIASLLISIIILGALTTVTLYTAKSVMTEQKISNNIYHSQQAFEAAEAGIGIVVRLLTDNPDRIIDPLFDSDADGTTDTNIIVIGSNNRAALTVTDVGIRLTPALPARTRMQIISQGFNIDNSAKRTITQVINKINPLPHVPNNPMITRGVVTITGTATVNNPEGHSTIWSGGNVEFGSNNFTSTKIVDVNAVNYPTCMDTSETCATILSSNQSTLGLDVIEYDSNLGNLNTEQFFENFFGMSPTLYKSTMVTLVTDSADANTDINLATSKVIWVDGNTLFTDVTVGCSSKVVVSKDCPSADLKPSVLIVNGNAVFTGNPHFYGIVFVAGTTTIIGHTTIKGSLISTETLNSKSGGNLDITYNSAVLERTREAGPMSASSGTWRDF